jgi:Leucine-rich repeat (LRR) protein
MEYPFKHLAAYERKDKAFYYGREKETGELYQICFETDLILLYGASGVGKSSLISCGLANKFKPYEWLEISVRRTHNINDSLTEKLNREIGDDSNETNIAEQIRLLGSKYFMPVYLIFDQFEELYISGEEEEQKLFYENVKTILSLNQPVKIIISIREEYLGYLYEFEKEIPQLFSHKCWVQPEKLKNSDIINGILKKVDETKDSLVKIKDNRKLVEWIEEFFEKAGIKTIELPSLQILFDEFYFFLTQDGNFKTEATFDYNKLKEEFANINIQDILWRYLNRLMDKQPVKSDIIWGVLLELVTEHGTKKNLSEKELENKFPELDIKQITNFFSDERDDKILNRIEQKGEVCYELRHDALAKCIREKLDKVIQIKELIKIKRSTNDDLKSFQLAEIDEYIGQLNNEEKKWVEKSRRKIRIKRLSIAGAFAIVSLLLVFAIWQWREAIRQSAIAEKAYSVFYFYDDKYALTNNKHGFYFIDKNGDPVDNINKSGYWDKAEPFDRNTGFAKVTRYGGEFLLDTLGRRYKYARNLNEDDTEALDLSNQPSNSFDLSLIGKNQNLKYLDLHKYKLTKLPPEIGNCRALEFLDLSRDSLITLPPEIGNLTNLKELRLDYNDLESLPAEIGNLIHLERLNLYGNDLKSLPPEIGKLTNLKTLNLCGNIHLIDIPAEIGNLTSLEELYLSIYLPFEIDKLTNLKRLNLSGSSNLTNISAEIGNLTNLEELWLSGGSLDSLSPEIGKLTNLKQLDLSNSNLTNLPVEIGNLTNLEELKLYNNHLKSLPPEIGKLTNLKRLILSWNNLAGLPVKIGNLINLEELDLYNNCLESLPSEIGKLTNLIKLNLERNQIKTLPPKIGNLVNLKNLGLKDNKITKLPKEIGNLKKLYITDLNDLNKLQLDSISKSYLKKIENWHVVARGGVVIEGGAAYKKGLRDTVIILKYGDWEINKDGNSLSEEIIDKYDDKEKDIIVMWKDGKIGKWESFHFDKGTVGLHYNTSFTITNFEGLKRRLEQLKNGSLIKYKELRLWNISRIVVYYKSRFPYIIPDAEWNFGLVWPVVIAGVIAGFIFCRKKRRLYQWLCWGIAGVTVLAIVGLYGYLLLA